LCKHEVIYIKSSIYTELLPIGDKLEEGDLLAEIETDKATMGFDTPEEGYLAKIILPAGSKDIPIGQLMCIIVQNEKDIDAFKDFTVPTDAIPPTNSENKTVDMFAKMSKLQTGPITSKPAYSPAFPASDLASDPASGLTSDPTSSPTSDPASSPTSDPASSPTSDPVSSPAVPKEKTFVTPLARKLAAEKGISLEVIDMS